MNRILADYQTGFLRWAVAVWRAGRGFGYPRCCCAHFIVTVYQRRFPGMERGGIHWGEDSAYVPCGLCQFRPRRWRAPHSATTTQPTVSPPR